MDGHTRRGPGLEGRSRSSAERWSIFWFGVGEALLVPLAFAALGLAWWGVERAEAAAGPYPGAMQSERERSADGELWLVDGYNVVQVALLADRDRSDWWTARYRDELMTRLRGFDALSGSAGAPEGSSPRLWVAFDGSRSVSEVVSEELGGEEPGGEGSERPSAEPVRAVFAPSADEWLLARVREAPDPGRVRLVTADRRLANRARHHRVVVVTPRALLDRCAERVSSIPDRGRKASI